jgi:hypothetical protein
LQIEFGDGMEENAKRKAPKFLMEVKLDASRSRGENCDLRSFWGKFNSNFRVGLGSATAVDSMERNFRKSEGEMFY